MKFSAKLTRNRIAATLRWIGLAAIDKAGTDPVPLGETLARFERAARATFARNARKRRKSRDTGVRP
jgi:hypothetical protein